MSFSSDIRMQDQQLAATLRLADLAMYLFLALALLFGLVALFQATITSWAITAVACLSMAFSARYGYRRGVLLSQQGMPDFLSVFLMFSAINKVFVIIHNSFGETEIDALDWLYIYQNIENRFLAELIFFVGTIFFTIGWNFISKKLEFQNVSYTSRQLFQMLLIFSIGWQVSEKIAILSGMVRFCYEAYLGIVFIILMRKDSFGVNGQFEFVTASLVIPAILSAVSSGIKWAIIIAAGPVILAYLLKPSMRGNAILFTAGVALFTIVQPISHVVREANWTNQEQIGAAEAFSRLFELYRIRGFGEVVSEGMYRFSARASASNDGAMVVAVRHERGPIGLETIRNVPIVFIPRVLWPSKPVIAPGAYFTYVLGRASSPEMATTATATPLATEFYWMAGWWSVVVGMFLLGAGFAWFWRFLIHWSKRSTIMMLAMFSLLMTAMTFQTMHAIYAITGPISLIAYVMPVALALHFLSRRRRRGGAVPIFS